jgi:hypothetical protein
MPSSTRHIKTASHVEPLQEDDNYSSPKCDQLYNVFHPSDPVSYRIEPLISTAMSELKPQSLPSIKRSIWTSSGQSISNISSRVGQSVGSIWTSFTSGVASSVLNRSLGLNKDGAAVAQLDASPRDATNTSDLTSGLSREGNLSKDQDYIETLVETEFETLYEGFNKTRRNGLNTIADNSQKESDTQADEERAARLRNEEMKVRALNSNGRVDYKIQE